MDIVNPMDGLEGIYSALNEYRSILSKFNTDNYSRLLESASQALKATAVIDDIVGREMHIIDSFNNPIFTYPETFSALTKQWDAVSKLAQSIHTPEMEKLHKALMDNDYGGINAFVSSLNAVNIEAQNMAFLKTTKLFADTVVALPKGLSSAIKGLHVETATRLLKADKLSFDIPSKMFYLEDDPEEKASIPETNIICASLNVLPDVDEIELITFLNHLSKFPNLALTHPVGQKIMEAVSNWSALIDFDDEMYYHARIIPEGACPYTEAQLLKAPSGVTWHGRYNFVGESHYYFSNKPKGATYEVFKHSKESKVQIAKLKPKRKIRMIDLSGENLSKNKFLEYCRFSPSPDDYSNIKREYLLPCFVANCCKYAKIDGIKYYGSKEYTNYVSWDDTYFDCVGFDFSERGA